MPNFVTSTIRTTLIVTSLFCFISCSKNPTFVKRKYFGGYYIDLNKGFSSKKENHRSINKSETSPMVKDIDEKKNESISENQLVACTEKVKVNTVSVERSLKKSLSYSSHQIHLNKKTEPKSNVKKAKSLLLTSFVLELLWITLLFIMALASTFNLLLFVAIFASLSIRGISLNMMKKEDQESVETKNYHVLKKKLNRIIWGLTIILLIALAIFIIWLFQNWSFTST